MSQYRPTASDLLLAVKRFLDESGTSLSGVQRYHAQVASYATGIVERELRLAPEADRLAQKRISGFLQRELPLPQLESQLAAAIRSGNCDQRWQEVLDLLLALLRDQVAIVKPGHLAPEHRDASTQD
jgi:hypothetical protein